MTTLFGGMPIPAPLPAYTAPRYVLTPVSFPRESEEDCSVVIDLGSSKKIIAKPMNRPSGFMYTGTTLPMYLQGIDFNNIYVSPEDALEFVSRYRVNLPEEDMAKLVAMNL